MTKYQFEELTSSLSIIITLLAYNFGIDWLFWLFLVKSIIDMYNVFIEAYKEIMEDKNKNNQRNNKIKNQFVYLSIIKR